MVSTRRRFSSRARLCNALREPLLNVGRDGAHLATRRLDAQVRASARTTAAGSTIRRSSTARGSSFISSGRVFAAFVRRTSVSIVGLEVDDGARLGEPLAVGGIEDDAAARGDDDAVERREVGDDLALALAKPRFALLLEDVADVDAGAFLDLGVAVEELLAEQRREPPARRRSCRSPWARSDRRYAGRAWLRRILKARRPPKGRPSRENPAGVRRLVDASSVAKDLRRHEDQQLGVVVALSSCCGTGSRGPECCRGPEPWSRRCAAPSRRRRRARRSRRR